VSYDKYASNLENFGRALRRFDAALQEPDTPIVRDGTIQRFEFSYELLWKTLKSFIEGIHGLRVVSPRQAFKEAFALELIDEEDVFLEMLESRNILAHTYDEEQARGVYQKCPLFLAAMKQVYERLKEQ
jgi:nucleotidyltransferase substrate binding protein (TIGR01987 family)